MPFALCLCTNELLYNVCNVCSEVNDASGNVKYQFYAVVAMLSVPKLLTWLCQLLSKMLDDGNTCKYKNSQNFCFVITPISYRGTNRCVTSVQSQTIVNKAEWLGSPANIKAANKDGKI